MTSEQSNADFPDTRWTLIDAVSQSNHPFRADAMQALAEGYWPAVYAYLRKRGKAREEAADMAQAFFAEIILGKDIFTQADQSRGRLRAFVLSALKHFLIDDHRCNEQRRRNHFLPFHNLHQEDQLLNNTGTGEAEDLFDRRWALSVLHEAMKRCEAHYRANGKVEHWNAFEARDIQPSQAMTDPPSYEQVAQKLGMPGAEQAIHAVRMVRKRMVTLLKQIAAETATNAADQRAEYEHVVALLS